jgi:uncharacterized membrane protein
MGAMRIVLTLFGAYAGIAFGSNGARVFDALMGALIGFAIGDLGVQRERIRSLVEDLARLRSALANLRNESVPSASPTPAPAPAAPAPAAPAPAAPVPAAAVPAAPVLAEHGVSAPTAFERPWREIEPAPVAGRAAARAVPPSAPRSPLVDALRGFFTGGNTLVRVGVIILLFGVAFLLRYMAEHTRVPIELRLSAIATAAIVLLVFGWRLRTSRAGYALAIQGGAVGILYLTVFAALRLYRLLPVSLAFALLAALAVGSAVLAVVQNSLSFALLGVAGGFLAPVLASTGEGSHVVLFGYYAVLNAGILAVAWFKAWRPLNIAGFVFTFAIGTAWGVLRYRPEEFATTEPFLVLFFIFYLGISVLFTLRQPPNLRGYVDGTLVFGTPLIAFALQSAMLHERVLMLAYSALAVSALYLVLAALLKRRRDETQRVLIEAFLALGVAFLTLAVPLALNVRWNALTWALEGAALVWVGCRQSRMLPRAFGALLILAAGFLVGAQFESSGNHLVLPLPGFYGALALSAACTFCARILVKYRERLSDSEEFLPAAAFCWGLLWWLAGGLTEVLHYLPTIAAAAALAFLAVTGLMSSELERWLQLGAARGAALFLLPVMACFAVAAALTQAHPFAHDGWVSWPLAFAVWYRIMYRHEGPVTHVLNAASAWLLCLMASWEAAWAVADWVRGSETWPAIAWAVIPGLALFSLPRLVTRVAWPFGKHRELYLFIVGSGLAVYLGLWSLVTNLVLPGNPDPLPYLPLLNPLDIAQALVLAVVARYWMFLRPVRYGGVPRIDPRLPLPALVALAFIWLNAVLLRTLHHWFGIPFEWTAMLASTLVETSLSIFWAILALSTMLIAARKRKRIAWLTGAVLLGVVIIKLFLLDLSRIGSIERIVSFVGVGLLMLVVGYFSPLPPPSEEPT